MGTPREPRSGTIEDNKVVQRKQRHMRNLQKVSVFGLGRVGLIMSVCLARRGYRVVGIDPDQQVLERLAKAKAPFYEPNLKDYLVATIKDGSFTATRSPSVNAQSDLAYLAVGTPSKPNGAIDLSHVEQAAKMIGQSLRDSNQHQLIVIKSTVTPGTARNIVTPVIERESRKRASVDFSVCSNPEFLREGNAIHDTERPDRIVIGSDDSASAQRLENFYREFHGSELPPVVRTTFENAELAKYAGNAFLATKISFINCIANIAERIPHADIKSIAEGIGLDKRIGPQFLNAGLGWGGSCFPKDLSSIMSLSLELGYDAELIRATIETNRKQAQKALQFAKKVIGTLAGKRVSILGLAFKPQTDDMREAISVQVINDFLDQRANVVVWDPEAMRNARLIFGDKITYARNAVECIDRSDCCIITTEWSEFKQISAEMFAQKMHQPIVIDGRRIYDVNKFRKVGIKLLAVGLGPDT
jgi:UDPglucose 6-dehydrogenase